MEIDREAALPLTADNALPGEIASTDVLEVEALVVRIGIGRRGAGADRQDGQPRGPQGQAAVLIGAKS